MVGFPYIPLFVQKPCREANSDSNAFRHSLLLKCRNENQGHTRFVSTHRGFIVRGHLQITEINVQKERSINVSLE